VGVRVATKSVQSYAEPMTINTVLQAQGKTQLQPLQLLYAYWSYTGRTAYSANCRNYDGKKTQQLFTL